MLLSELKRFEQFLDFRINEIENADSSDLIEWKPMQSIIARDSFFYTLQNRLTSSEQLMVICALIPHIAPDFFTERLRSKKSSLSVHYSCLGGYIDSYLNQFAPTLQTV